MCKVNVYEMAAARDKRRERQKIIIKNFKYPLISFTLNIPGTEKNNTLYRRIHNAGISSIQGHFRQRIRNLEIYSLKTGPEAYISIDMNSEELKKEAVNIEETHRFGRIFDMDVIDIQCRSISRKDLHCPPRKCLICSEDAAVCSRSRKHNIEELLSIIRSIGNVL